MLAVANWDSRAIDFYVSTARSLSDPTCRFKLQTHWQVDSAETSDWQPDRTFGTYQAVNLVFSARGELFLIGLNTTQTGRDIVDLFQVRLDSPPDDVTPAKLLQKLAQKRLMLPRENRFRSGGGIWVDRGRLAILSSQHDLAPETWIGIAR